MIEMVSRSTARTVAVVSNAPDRRERLRDAVARLGHRVPFTAPVVTSLPGDPSDPPELVVLMLENSRSEVSIQIGELREQLPEACLLLILPTETTPDRRIAALGADGVIYESELAETLAPALAALLAGLAVLPRELNSRPMRPNFSAREKQVLGMVVLGLSNVEIASKLYLAESTVKSHLSTAFRKLGVASRKEAVARILDPEHGLGPGILAISRNDEPGGDLAAHPQRGRG